MIKYGDQGSDYFILSKGTVRVTLYEADADPNDPKLDQKKKAVKFLEKGTGFGELALLYNDKRSATIDAHTDDCEFYILNGTVFKSIIIKSSIDNRSEKSGFLNQIKLFDTLDKFQKLKLIDGLQTVKLEFGNFVFREGDHGDDFYIIEQGETECLKLHQAGESGAKKDFIINVRTLSKGDHFGELALINNDKRSLSVRVTSKEC